MNENDVKDKSTYPDGRNIPISLYGGFNNAYLYAPLGVVYIDAYFDNNGSYFYSNTVITIGVGFLPVGQMDNVDNNGEWKFGVVNIDAYYAFANPWNPDGISHICDNGILSVTYSTISNLPYGVVRRQQYVR